MAGSRPPRLPDRTTSALPHAGVEIMPEGLLMCIREGANEMQRMIIARQWLKRNPA